MVASVLTFANSSIAESPTSSSALSTSLPEVDIQTDPATPAISPAAPVSSKVTANATVTQVIDPVSQPVIISASTPVNTPVYTSLDTQFNTTVNYEGTGTASAPIVTPVVSPTNQSSPIEVTSNQTFPTITAITLSTPYYVPGTGNIPIGTGTPARPTYVKPINGSSNGTCGCTVNVRGAEIGYWYSLDQYYQIVTFFTTSSGTQFSWGYVTATTTFDLVESVQEGLVDYQITSAWDPYLNQTTIDFIAITRPMPAAATTTITSLNEFLPIPTTPLTQQNLLDDLYTEPPPPSVAFTGPSSTVFVASSGTPYVAYSSYEVESSEQVVDAYGKVSCRSSVATYDLPAPYAFEYNGDKLGTSTEATGLIPEDFLQQIPQSTCVAGSYQGPVTVYYIVHVIYGSKYTPFIGHVESSVDNLEVPTLIDGPSSTTRPKAHVETTVEVEPPATTSRKGILKFTTRAFNDYIAHIESVLSELNLPTVVFVNTKASVTAGDSKATDSAVAPGSGNSVSTARPTQLNQNDGDNDDNNNSGSSVPNLGAIISAVVSQATSGGNSQNGGSGSNSGASNNAGGGGVPDLGAVISAVVSQATSGGNSQNSGSGSGSGSSNPDSSNDNANPGSGSGSSGSGSNSGSNSGSGSGSGSGSSSGSGNSPGSGSGNSGGSSGSQNGGSGNSPPVIVAGTQTATMDSSSGFIIGGLSLSPGGPAITVDGTVLSLSPSATAVVINGQTSPLSGSQSNGGQQGAPELGKPPIITVGSAAYTANAATQYYLAPDQTLTAGGVATVGGTVVSLGPSASYVVINGATQTFPSALITPAPNPAFAVGAAPALVIAGQTLRPGGSIVISGTTIALDSGANNLIVDGVTRPVGSGTGVAGQPVITIAGTAYAAADGTSFIVGNQVLTPGGVIVVDGSTVSLDASDSTVYINGVASPLGGSNSFSTALPVLTIGGSTFVPEAIGSAYGYEIGGQTLLPGESITVDGTVISLASGATALVVDGVTQWRVGVMTNAPDLTIGGTVYTDLSGPGTTYVIAGQTLTPGGVIVVDGTTISLSPSATALVVNGVTQTLFPATAVPGSTRFPVLTIDGQTYTAIANSGAAGGTYVIDGQTLTPGGSIVIDGTTISLSPSATVLVVDGHTQTLVPASATRAEASAERTSTASAGATATQTAAATGAAANGAADKMQSGSFAYIFLSGLLALIGFFLW